MLYAVWNSNICIVFKFCFPDTLEIFLIFLNSLWSFFWVEMVLEKWCCLVKNNFLWLGFLLLASLFILRPSDFHFVCHFKIMNFLPSQSWKEVESGFKPRSSNIKPTYLSTYWLSHWTSAFLTLKWEYNVCLGCSRIH